MSVILRNSHDGDAKWIKLKLNELKSTSIKFNQVQLIAVRSILLAAPLYANVDTTLHPSMISLLGKSKHVSMPHFHEKLQWLMCNIYCKVIPCTDISLYRVRWTAGEIYAGNVFRMSQTTLCNWQVSPSTSWSCCISYWYFFWHQCSIESTRVSIVFMYSVLYNIVNSKNSLHKYGLLLLADFWTLSGTTSRSMAMSNHNCIMPSNPKFMLLWMVFWIMSVRVFLSVWKVQLTVQVICKLYVLQQIYILCPILI